MIKAYEVQTFRKGVRQVDSVFDDEDLAEFEARSLFDRGRYVGVRVVLETYNPDTNELSARTVLKLEKADKSQAEIKELNGRETRKTRKAGTNKVKNENSKKRKLSGTLTAAGPVLF